MTSAVRAPAPSAARVLVVGLVALALVAGLAVVARVLAPQAGSAWGLVASAVCGVVAMVIAGSLAEWLVHRYLMHGRSRWRLLRIAYDLHHRAHHWIHYPPDAYLKAEVTYVPAVPPRPDHLCETRAQRLGAVLGQVVFYGAFALPILAVGWLATGNVPFVAALGAVSATIIGLAIHVHDAVHCPGYSRLERFGWFWFLDRHHYIHHVDTKANTNFLLPLGDLAMGTLRRALTEAELRRWPTYEQAREWPAAERTEPAPSSADVPAPAGVRR